MDTITNSHFIDEKWKMEVKTVLEEALQKKGHIRMVTGDFPTGDVLHIPTIGQITARDYTEGTTIQTEDLSSSDFQLQITEYTQAGVQLTDKFKDDSVYVSTLVDSLKVNIVGALMRRFESDIAALQGEQTASNPNSIDGADHRFVSIVTNNVGGLEDFHLAMLALNKSNALTSDNAACISPEFLYRLQLIGNLVNQQIYGTNNLIKDGGLQGKVILAANAAAPLVGSISGFQVYADNVLEHTISETVSGTANTPWSGSRTVSTGKANMFMGHEALIGAMRTMPSIEEFRDPKTKSTYFHSTFRYGLDLYRPESLVVCLTDPA